VRRRSRAGRAGGRRRALGPLALARAVSAGALAAAVLALPAAAAGGAPGTARALRADAASIGSAVGRVRVTMGVLACVAEAAGMTGAEAAAHQLGTCRVTAGDPADRPDLAANPGPAHFSGPAALLRAAAADLGRRRWPPAVAGSVRALRRSVAALAADLGSTAGGGGTPWSTGVERAMAAVTAATRSIERRLGPAGAGRGGAP
jgi:hypothetical protein